MKKLLFGIALTLSVLSSNAQSKPSVAVLDLTHVVIMK
jgi:hypothetical protein